MNEAGPDIKLMAAASSAIPEAKGRKWKPGVMASFPYLGIGTLCLSILFTAAAIGIVLASDGKPTDEWSGNRQPGVLLAYTSTLANAVMAVALSEAVVVGYWTRALRGVPMSNLHYNWAGGSGAMGAIKSLCHRRGLFVSIVCLLSTVTSLLRGPLMQRASLVQTETALVPGETNLQLTYNVSASWAGTTHGRAQQDLVFDPSFSAVVRGFQARTPILVPESGPQCANCSLSVPAFGFAIDCTTSDNIPYNISGDLLALGYRPNATVFNSTVTGYTNESEERKYLSVIISRRTTTAKEGFLSTETCLLKPAVMKYDLLLNNGSVTFQKDSWRDDTVVNQLEYLAFAAGGRTTITALQVFGSAVYEASSYLENQDARGWVLDNTRLLANTYFDSAGSSGRYDQAVFSDPMPDILNAFREVGLRMSVAAAAAGGADAPPDRLAALPYSQTVGYMSQRVGVVYRADRASLVLAVIISLLGPVATFALFWGWWALGRQFSLSPMEVVNAFYRPPQPQPQPMPSSLSSSGDDDQAQQQGYYDAVRVLSGCNGNATAEEVVAHVQEARNGGDMLVCYGLVGEESRLCMGLPQYETVRHPWPGDEL